MSSFWRFTTVFACVATAAMWADTYNKMTKVTFSGPVQVPSPHAKTGVVTLPAGTYVFKLQDSSSQRHIVTITNLRGDKVLTTILAIPDYRVNATSKTVMYFSETKAGTPMPIKSWFYPGDNYGQRFVYPKVKAQEIAAEIKQPVPSYTAEKVEVATPVAIQTPAKEEVAYTPTAFEKTDATDTAGVDGEAVKEPTPTPAAMPKTASPVHLFGLLGAVLLMASLALRRASSVR